MSNSTDGGYASASFVMSGANTLAAGSPHRMYMQTVASGRPEDRRSYAKLFTGLNPGSTTITMKYSSITAGTSTYDSREISAIPLQVFAESAVTANKVDWTTFPLSSSTDANGWLVKDYGIFKIATKTLSATASKVRFETATQSSSNLPVGVSTIAGLTSYFATIEAGNFSDFTALTRQNNGSSGTALAFVYMYLGPTSTTSYTVPVKFTAIF